MIDDDLSLSPDYATAFDGASDPQTGSVSADAARRWQQAAQDAGLDHDGGKAATAQPAAGAATAGAERHWYDRPLGVLQAVGGVGEAAVGGALLATPEPTMLTKVAGVAVGLHGIDDIQAGLRTAWTGQPTPTVTQQAVTGGAQALGTSPGAAIAIGTVVDGGLGMANPEGEAGKVVRGAVELSEAERAAQSGGALARGTSDATEASRAVTVSTQDLTEFRTRIGVPETNTVAVARTNVPGLESQVFEGASRVPRREAGLPQAEAGPISSPNASPLFRNHAEEDIANQFVAAVDKAGLKSPDLDNKEILIRVQNEAGVCGICRQGLRNPDVPPGVLKQLSERYPGLSVHIIVDNPGPKLKGPSDFIVRNGSYGQ